MFKENTANNSVNQKTPEHRAIDLASTGTWLLDLQSGDVIINSHVATMLGYEPEEVMPVTLEKWRSFLHPDDRENAEKELALYLEGKTTFYENRVRLRQKDGTYKWILTRGEFVKPSNETENISLSGIHIDIDDLIVSKEKLMHHLQLEKIVYSITAEMIQVTPETIDLKINSALREIGEYFDLDRIYIFMLRNEEVIDNTHEWCKEGIMETIQYLQGIPVEGLKWWYEEVDRYGYIHIPRLSECEDESTKFLLMPFGVQSLLSVPIIVDNDYAGLIGFDAVTSEKRWDENEINVLKSIAFVVSNAISAVRREKQLIEAREKAHESDKIKSAFLSSISHEFRTPLHHVIGFSELIAGWSENEEIGGFAKLINDSGKKLLNMMEDLFDLSAFQESNMRQRNEEFRLFDLFNELRHGFIDMLNNSEKSEMILNKFEADDELLQKIIIGDKSKITGVLNNLYRNALKFTENGFIRFHIMKNSDNQLLFIIQDTGIGIEQKMQKEIFNLFTRGNSKITTPYAGIGIGLSIAQLLTKSMKGQLFLDSEPGKGTTFYLSIDYLEKE